MRSITLSFLFLFLLNTTFTQVNIEGKIVDAATQDPIPFVNIGIKKLATGTVTDEEGNYILTLKKETNNEMVTISSIGYVSKQIQLQDLMKKPKVELEARPYEAPMVELSAKKLLKKEITIGNDQVKRDNSVGFGGSQLGTEIGALLPIVKETWLKSAHFVVNRTNGDKLLFRLNIYKYQNEKVGDNLLSENILVEAPLQKGVLNVDLSDYNILVDQDIILSLQWIKDYDGKGEVIISFNANRSKKHNNFFLKNTSVSDYKRVSTSIRAAPKMALCFYVIGQQVKE